MAPQKDVKLGTVWRMKTNPPKIFFFFTIFNQRRKLLMFPVSQFNIQQQIINETNTCLIKSFSTGTSSLPPSLFTGQEDELPYWTRHVVIKEENNFQVSDQTQYRLRNSPVMWSKVFLLLKNSLNPSVSNLLIKILEIAQFMYTELYKEKFYAFTGPIRKKRAQLIF